MSSWAVAGTATHLSCEVAQVKRTSHNNTPPVHKPFNQTMSISDEEAEKRKRMTEHNADVAASNSSPSCMRMH